MILLITVLAFIINLPAGYYRSRSPKYSRRWFLFIHLPVPFIIAARLLAHVEYNAIPLFIAAAFIGQFIGGKIECSRCS